MSKVNVEFIANDTSYKLEVEPRESLADSLRDKCDLTGTHLGCEHGICGACTILINNEPVRSCLMFTVQASGKKIRTVEGLADGDELSIIQKAFWNEHGLQCGFCTPGFLMLSTWLLENEKKINKEKIKDLLSSNLCRCTGYQNILKAVESAAKEIGLWEKSEHQLDA